jgi:hypothetical protein
MPKALEKTTFGHAAHIFDSLAVVANLMMLVIERAALRRMRGHLWARRALPLPL